MFVCLSVFYSLLCSPSVSQVELNECVQCEFSFINTGKFNFSYQAELSGPKTLLQYLDFTPTDGSVDVGQSEPASLSFQPYQKCVLKGLELKIKVRAFNLFQMLKESVVCCPSWFVPAIPARWLFWRQFSQALKQKPQLSQLESK